MNFAEDVNKEFKEEIDTNLNCEIFTNKKYYGNQTLDNLIGLKLKVHNVLNVTHFIFF